MNGTRLLLAAFHRSARANEARLAALSPADLARSDRQGSLSDGQRPEHLIGGRTLSLNRAGSRHAAEITFTDDRKTTP